MTRHTPPTHGLAALCLVLSLTVAACASSDATTKTRDPRWATPMTLPGLPNLHKVTPDLYRGAQPSQKGFAELKRLGIRTVVSLREHHTDEDELKRAGLTAKDLRLVSIPIDTAKLTESQMIEFLKIATDPASQPVLVHCLHGADRTGTAIATYRLAVEGWTKQDAIDELRLGGYGFHEMWKNLPAFIEGLDVEKFKEKLGMKATLPPQ